MYKDDKSERGKNRNERKERTERKDRLRYRRLINRCEDNQSGFMVTTDYQVVQESIFHIATVPYSDEGIPVLHAACVSMWAHPRHYHRHPFLRSTSLLFLLSSPLPILCEEIILTL